MTEDILTMKDRPKLVATTEAYYAMKMHVLVRFGRWHEILLDGPPGDLSSTRSRRPCIIMRAASPTRR